MSIVLFAVQYDKEAKRWTARCGKCSYSATRAKREAAEHILHMHIAYSHEADGAVAS